MANLIAVFFACGKKIWGILEYPFHHALRYAAVDLIVVMVIPLNTEQQAIF